MVFVGLVDFLHHWHIKYTDVTAYIAGDSCTYLSPALRGRGRAPGSSMSKLIGLTKALAPAKHKKQAQFILMGISKAFRWVCIARSCFQTAHRVNTTNLGESRMRSSRFCHLNFFPSFNFQRPTRWGDFAFLTMNICAFRCSCQLPSAVRDVKSLEGRCGRFLFG